MRRNILSLNNLLVGDWLVDIEKNKPFQVTIEWLKEMNECLKNNKDINSSPLLSIQTESISQNILSKNDFKLKTPELKTFSESKVWVLEVEEEQFKIELECLSRDSHYYFVARGYCGLATFELYIDEVWELQRILKFHNINKEIIV